MRSYKFLVILGLFLLIGVGYSYVNNHTENKLDLAESEVIEEPTNKANIEGIELYNNEPEKSYVNTIFSINKNDIVLGNRDSKIMVFEYSSYSCTHCENFHAQLFPKIKKDFIQTSKIAYVVRQYIFTAQDLDGVILTKCAGNLMWEKFHDILFTRQADWVYKTNYKEILNGIALVGGLTKEKYSECLKDDNFVKDVIDNTRVINQSKIMIGTPSFFIVLDGKYLYNVVNYNKLYEILENLSNSQK